MALTWLIDTSALVRFDASPDAGVWAERIQRGLVRIATVTRLEMGYTARAGQGQELRKRLRQPPLSFMPTEYQTPRMEDRAVEIQMLLADQGQHRAASIPDLMVAATGEIAGLTVLHLDKDFDLISEVTNQPVERLRVEDDVERHDVERASGPAARRKEIDS
ncbi:MAG TPA: PIN domain nuclease [Acidimicrobiales bacterium]